MVRKVSETILKYSWKVASEISETILTEYRCKGTSEISQTTSKLSGRNASENSETFFKYALKIASEISETTSKLSESWVKCFGNFWKGALAISETTPKY